LLKRILLLFVFVYAINAPLNAQNIQNIPILASKLGLYGGMKATIQWERIFSSEKRLQRYKLDTLPKSVRDELKIYLIEHAADSEQPIVPGL
jgi:hypothetical protein